MKPFFAYALLLLGCFIGAGAPLSIAQSSAADTNGAQNLIVESIDYKLRSLTSDEGQKYRVKLTASIKYIDDSTMPFDRLAPPFEARIAVDEKGYIDALVVVDVEL